MDDINSDWKRFTILNHKLHIYLGLFITVFIWLFFVSGLIMNHGKWNAANFYKERIENKIKFNVSASMIIAHPDKVTAIKEHLHISGEVTNIRAEKGNILFRVSSPGIVQDVEVDSTGAGTLKIIKYNFWGKLHTLHLFNGMNRNDSAQRPGWIITKSWKAMMDITAIILIILSLGSWIMWYKVRKNYKAGFIFLASGIIVAVYYLFLIDII